MVELFLEEFDFLVVRDFCVERNVVCDRPDTFAEIEYGIVYLHRNTYECSCGRAIQLTKLSLLKLLLTKEVSSSVE